MYEDMLYNNTIFVYVQMKTYLHKTCIHLYMCVYIHTYIYNTPIVIANKDISPAQTPMTNTKSELCLYKIHIVI